MDTILRVKAKAVDLLPSGRAKVRAVGGGSIEAFFGCVPAGGRAVSIEDMNEVIADGWAAIPA